MEISYPLYDELSSLNSNLEISIEQISFTLMNLRNKQHLEEIYTLILHYAITVDKYQNLSFPPYKGTVLGGGTGINFQLANLPLKLQIIIAYYLQKYQKK